jgi:hypothetical protein
MGPSSRFAVILESGEHEEIPGHKLMEQVRKNGASSQTLDDLSQLVHGHVPYPILHKILTAKGLASELPFPEDRERRFWREMREEMSRPEYDFVPGETWEEFFEDIAFSAVLVARTTAQKSAVGDDEGSCRITRPPSANRRSPGRAANRGCPPSMCGPCRATS